MARVKNENVKVKAKIFGTDITIKSNLVNNDTRIKGQVNTFTSATTEKKGIIRIATVDEALQGEDNTIAITPFTLKDFVDDKFSDLAEVAFTGDYNDLSNKPVIDSELSTTSTNAVQNSVITQALQNIDVDTLIPVTYAELVELKTNSQLKAGAFYRMTDFVTTTNGITYNGGESCRSAGHQFDLIIQALGESNLSDICTAALHENDTYFANNNLGSWQIWYDIENNVSKYGWADTTNGKGVIYRLIDEYNNDLSYDFKNIQFLRDKTATKYSTIASYLTANDNYYYTFSYIVSGVATDYSITAQSHCSYNQIPLMVLLGALTGLNNNVFIAKANNERLHHNIFGITCYGNTAITPISSNTIGNRSYNNVINSEFELNSVGSEFRNNTLGTKFYYNSVGTYFYNNTTNTNFYYNTIGHYCHDNTFALNSFSNVIGNAFYNNTNPATSKGVQQCVFGNVVHHCSFGDTFQRNVLGNAVLYMTFGINNKFSRFGSNIGYFTISDNCADLVVENDCAYVNVTIPNVYFTMDIHGASNTNRFTTSGLPTAGTYNITIKTDSNGAVLATYNDGANEIGYKKATVTTSAWSELLPTFTWEGS